MIPGDIDLTENLDFRAIKKDLQLPMLPWKTNESKKLDSFNIDMFNTSTSFATCDNMQLSMTNYNSDYNTYYTIDFNNRYNIYDYRNYSLSTTIYDYSTSNITTFKYKLKGIESIYSIDECDDKLPYKIPNKVDKSNRCPSCNHILLPWQKVCDNCSYVDETDFLPWDDSDMSNYKNDIDMNHDEYDYLPYYISQPDTRNIYVPFEDRISYLKNLTSYELDALVEELDDIDQSEYLTDMSYLRITDIDSSAYSS